MSIYYKLWQLSLSLITMQSYYKLWQLFITIYHKLITGELREVLQIKTEVTIKS